MPEEELKKLSPEERVKRLKELEEKKKKEIEEARKMLRESEKEIADREEWGRKVPIPQVAAEGVSGMSEAEKEIFQAHKGVREEKEERLEKEESPVRSRSVSEEESLEETVAKEKVELPPELRESDYTVKLSQEPMKNLYREIKDIYQAVGEKGYVSPEEERRIGYISAATEKKLEDAEAGEYDLIGRVAEEAMLTRKIGANLMYRRSGEGGRRDYQR